MAHRVLDPGEHLAEELRARGMNAAEVVRQTRLPTKRITEILNGQPALTRDAAQRMGHFFSTDPDSGSASRACNHDAESGQLIIDGSNPLRVAAHHRLRLPRFLDADVAARLSCMSPHRGGYGVGS